MDCLSLATFILENFNQLKSHSGVPAPTVLQAVLLHNQPLLVLIVPLCNRQAQAAGVSVGDSVGHRRVS